MFDGNLLLNLYGRLSTKLLAISNLKCLMEIGKYFAIWPHCTAESERTFSSSSSSLSWEGEPGWVGKWRLPLSVELETELAQLTY